METLQVGATGAGELHQRLIEAGYFVAEEELSSGTFGPSTLQAVREFQAAHVGADRQHLTVDGVVGPATWWALEHPGGPPGAGVLYAAPGWRCEPSKAPAEVQQAILVAVGEMGNREDPDGSNRGPAIDKYGQNGQPWCAYWLSWVFAKLPEGCPFGIIGSAYGLSQWAARKGRVVEPQVALLPGDVGIILREALPGEKPRGHVEMIVDVDGGTLSTIGGNVSNSVRGVVCQRARFKLFARPVLY